MFSELLEFDMQLKQNYGKFLAGADEAGRGPLAGPVCCAAVVLKQDANIEGLNDSKKLTEKKREALFDVVVENCLSYSIVFVDNKKIDEINILQASLVGMKQAAELLETKPDILLIDGNFAVETELCKSIAVVKGDGKSAAIAAASILAKVSRDRYMKQLDQEFPEYGFAQHKGYPTKAHYQAIDQHGITEYHRRSFLKGRV